MESTHSKRGKFIVIEGLDGSGKGTQISLLEKSLSKMGIAVQTTAEPTQSATGGLIRDTLGGLQKRTPYELAALFLTDRIFHNVSPSGIKKMLESGINVICDRYYYSSFAYQGMDADLSWVMDMNLSCAEIEKPDLCIFLDVDVENCSRRMSASRFGREIFENEEAMIRIRKRFFDVFEKLKDTENIVVINADGDAEAIAEQILCTVNNILC